MNIIAARAAAFIVGSMIAGCVYATNNASNSASAATFASVAVYPAAKHTSGNSDGDGADVTVHMPMVSLRLRAERFDSNDAPSRVIAFYRTKLAKLGKVTEKSGGPHTQIEGFHWTTGPGQTTLAAGKMFVAVKPLGTGSEFALIQIDTASPESHPSR